MPCTFAITGCGTRWIVSISTVQTSNSSLVEGGVAADHLAEVVAGGEGRARALDHDRAHVRGSRRAASSAAISSSISSRRERVALLRPVERDPGSGGWMLTSRCSRVVVAITQRRSASRDRPTPSRAARTSAPCRSTSSAAGRTRSRPGTCSARGGSRANAIDAPPRSTVAPSFSVDERLRPLAPVLVRDRDDRALEHRRVGDDRLLDLDAWRCSRRRR